MEVVVLVFVFANCSPGLVSFLDYKSPSFSSFICNCLDFIVLNVCIIHVMVLLLIVVVVKGGNNLEDWRSTGHAMVMKRTPWTGSWYKINVTKCFKHQNKS